MTLSLQILLNLLEYITPDKEAIQKIIIIIILRVIINIAPT